MSLIRSPFLILLLLSLGGLSPNYGTPMYRIVHLEGEYQWIHSVCTSVQQNNVYY